MLLPRGAAVRVCENMVVVAVAAALVALVALASSDVSIEVREVSYTPLYPAKGAVQHKYMVGPSSVVLADLAIHHPGRQERALIDLAPRSDRRQRRR